jgi:hypothetical protein
MNYRNQLADENLHAGLGKTLIQWMSRMNERKQSKRKGSVNIYKNGGSESRQYSDLLSVKINNADSNRSRKNDFYGE